ncbi:MAG: pimeloyl-ACP methyl ester esterase BioH [Methylococcaceae bacterium]|jgi:pimeloyl-[acyl-carrier protein] methyl ester esterase
MGKIHVCALGHGKPIVLVHGWAMHSGVWGDFAKHLSRSYRVICIDLPGHGQSVGEHEYTLANICKALVDAIDEPACCWLGWSLGATIVLEVARRYPSRVNALLLLAGNPCFINNADWPGVSKVVLSAFTHDLEHNQDRTILRFLSLQSNGSKPILKQLKLALSMHEPPQAKALLAGLSILQNSDLRAWLPAISCPMAVILGALDPLVPSHVGLALKKIAPDIKLTSIGQGGHLPFLSHEQEVITAINNFLDA